MKTKKSGIVLFLIILLFLLFAFSITAITSATNLASSNPIREHENNAMVFVINELGYEYSFSPDIKTSSVNVDNFEIGDFSTETIGTDTESNKIVCESWDIVQNYVSVELLSVIKNQHISTVFPDFNAVIDSDIITVNYWNNSSKMSIQIVKVARESGIIFDYRRYFPDGLANLTEIMTKNGNVWQCFSFTNYFEEKQTGAVLAKGLFVYEITFSESSYSDLFLEVLESVVL